MLILCSLCWHNLLQARLIHVAVYVTCIIVAYDLQVKDFTSAFLNHLGVLPQLECLYSKVNPPELDIIIHSYVGRIFLYTLVVSGLAHGGR